MNSKLSFQCEILDCTIRDGGYINNWHFDKKMVKEFYRNISKTGVDIIELGFRNTPPDSDIGMWYSVWEELLHELLGDISGVSIALMLDYGKSDISNIPKSDKSLVSLYRIACHKDKIAGALRLCEEIKNKGYKTSIQLMGIAGYTQGELDSVIESLTGISLDYVYFADSYGSLLPQDIAKYVKMFKRTKKKIGFHAHNSLQLAFANTLEALNNGVDIIDATVFGMGRGSGNLPLETLIAFFEKTLNHKKYNSLPILDLIDRYFIELHNEFKWGYSLPYMLSGIFEVHPNYAKNLVDYHEYNVDDIVKVLEIVKDLKPIGFDKGILERIINSGFVSPAIKSEGSMHDSAELNQLLEKYPITYKNRHAGRDFLILANGPSLKEHKEEIDSFIKRYNPIVLGANYLGGLFKPDYHAFSNKKRFVSYIDGVGENSALLLSSSFDDDFIREYTDRDFESIVHLNRVSSSFDINNGVITSNCRTVSMLLVAVAVVMGAKRIFIAGMDGYKSKENFLSNNTHFYKESEETDNFKLLIEKHNWNDQLLNSINTFLTSGNKEGVHIITPTSHKRFYNSIYNWIK
ncbi:hypothetical protein HQ584_04335 [Patescibacteria group bacterium]|nr:hypothetical protein [Patescibacteria group bacterium]